MSVPEADEKGKGDTGVKAAATAVLASRRYDTTNSELCLVSIEALAKLADSIDNPSLAQVIRSTGADRAKRAAAIADVKEPSVQG